MVEVMVWLLIATSGNEASSTVAIFKTKEKCEATLVQLRYNGSAARCIQADVLVPR